MFDRLRGEDPVHWTPEADDCGFWAVAGLEDIARSTDPETFTSTRYVNLEEVDDDLMDIRRSMLETDGARHRALRKLIPREFTEPLTRKYEEFLRGLTKVTVNGRATLEFDFVEKVSADFPIHVLVRLLDVPVNDTGMLIDWGNQM